VKKLPILVKDLLVIGGLGLVLATTPLYAQNTSVIEGGPHDLSGGSALRNGDPSIDGQTCIFCHTPHGGANDIPLWNRAAPTGGSYLLYTSTTSDSTASASQIANSVSGACMSCHDGTIAVDVLTNVNGLPFGPAVSFTTQGTAKSTYSGSGAGSNNVMTGGLPFLGTDLRNDHPVAIVYDDAQSATPSEFVAPTVVGGKIAVGTVDPVPLFGTSLADARVECASCHNAHNNTLGNFLRKANTGSAICLTCHIK
jgi:predicted CXXCH cytochrome family protein